jgi:hypothetical protein
MLCIAFPVVFFSVFRVYPLVQLTEYNIKFSTHIRCVVISVRRRTPILYPTDVCVRNMLALVKAPRNSLILFDYFIFRYFFVLILHTSTDLLLVFVSHCSTIQPSLWGDLSWGWLDYSLISHVIVCRDRNRCLGDRYWGRSGVSSLFTFFK